MAICHLGFLKSRNFIGFSGWRGSRRISMANFVKIGQSVAKILRFFDLSRWRPPPSWIFKFVKCYWLMVSEGHKHITVPNFVKIGRSVAEILRFFEFLRWPLPPSWIFEIAKFYRLLGWRWSRRISMPHFVKIGQSVAKIIRFFDFSSWWPPLSWIEFAKFYWLTLFGGAIRITIVKIGFFVADILQFLKFSNCLLPPLSWIFEITKFHQLFGWTGSRCISLQNFVKIGRSVMEIGNFQIFKWPPPPSWIVEKVETHQHANFR